mgnify:CR=1 FL=1
MIKKIKSSLLALLLTLGFSTSAISEGLSLGLQFHVMGFYGVGTENMSNNSGTKHPTTEAGAFTDEIFSVFAE